MKKLPIDNRKGTYLNSNMDRIQSEAENAVSAANQDLNSNMDRIQSGCSSDHFSIISNLNSNMDRIQFVMLPLVRIVFRI